MTAEKIKARIAEHCTLFGFEYKGKIGDVDPYSDDSYDLTYDGETINVHSIDEVMNTPYFDGKCLNEIYNEIEITEW